jgi:hypothetical protein
MSAILSLRIVLAIGLVAVSGAFAEALEPGQQAKLDAKVAELKAWSMAPEIVAAVKAHNAKPEHPDYTNDSWKALTVLDPAVRAFQQNAAATWIKSKKGEAVTEAFVSGADGAKVAFLSKPSGWTHKGKPKHDKPMTGKNWQGEIEVDASTGARQIQVSVPVLDGGKAIGSIVVGFSVAKL